MELSLLKCAENIVYGEPNSCRLLRTNEGHWCQIPIGCLHVLIRDSLAEMTRLNTNSETEERFLISLFHQVKILFNKLLLCISVLCNISLVCVILTVQIFKCK